MSQLQYRPEIDGLRTLAIIPVILFHINRQWLQGGFAGVDVFFVISGYLITYVLMKELAEHRFSLTGFWIRRIRRLMPALTTMVLVTLIVGRFVLLPAEWGFLGIQGASAILSAANFTFWKVVGNYWGPTGEDMFLLHSWSLSVEEQFYLFYPVILALLYRYARHRMRMVVFLGSVVSFVLCLIGLTRFTTFSFYMLPMRGWEMGVGGLLAMSHGDEGGQKTSIGSPVLAAIGVLGIIFSYFLISDQQGFPGYQSLLPVMSTLLVIRYCKDNDKWAGRILASGPFVYIGKASYSLYLWHWPVLVFVRTCARLYDIKISLGETLALIVLCSAASYHLVEKIGKARNAWRVYVPILFAGCLALAANDYYANYNFDYSSFGKVEWRACLFDVTPIQRPWQGEVKKRMEGIVTPLRADERSNAFSSGGIIRNYDGKTPSIMVLGDSHALMWSSTIDDVCRELGVSVSFFAAFGSYALFDEHPRRAMSNMFTADQNYAFDKSRLDSLRAWRPKVVILVQRWDERIGDEESLRGFIKFLGRYSSIVLLVEQPPVLYFGDRNALQIALYLQSFHRQKDPLMGIGNPSSWSAANAMIHRLAQGNDNCDIIRVSDLYEFQPGRVRFIEGSQLVYIDDDHLSEFGAHLAKSRIKSSISKALGKPEAAIAEKNAGFRGF